MLYLLTGKGAMPPKEATTVLSQLLERAEAEAAESGQEELEFWLAVDSDHIDREQRIWPAVSQWATDNDIYVADTGNALKLLESERDTTLLLVPVDPSFADPEDEYLAGLTGGASLLGIAAKCFNGQMYDVEVEAVEEAPAAEEQPVEQDLESMPMADLKSLARGLGAEPENWRSRKAIIAAIESPDEQPAPEPLDVIEVSNTVEDPEDSLDDQTAVQVDEWLRSIVRDELVSLLTSTLSRLLED
jgi:hypothetical protein